MTMTNQETDTALLLEDALKQRVEKITRGVLRSEVHRLVDEYILKQKNDMMMEISLKVGQMLRGIAEEDRTPLWELGSNATAGIKKYEPDPFERE